MDLVAEYAFWYSAAPRHDQPWHEVLALIERCGRFEARTKLATAEGSMLGRPVGESLMGMRDLVISALERQAYPPRNS